MSTLKLSCLGLLVFFVIFGISIAGWVIGSYNSMITEKETVSTTWSQVEVQYQRRYDLIPNLTNATRGYMIHEETVFKDIADARTKYANAPNPNSKVEAASGLEGALARLLVVMENYPNLKADQTVKGLTDELAGTENRVAVARERYNEAARDYNIHIKQFPKSVLAGLFGFKENLLFTVQIPDANKAPTVNLEVK